jgi:hypothetical protein
MTTPRRNGFSFSLRTLFVVLTVLAIPLGWLGYQLNWIRRRHDARQSGDLFTSLDDPFKDEHYFAAPFTLRMFGEVGVERITLVRGGSQQEIERIRRLFPEAQVKAHMETGHAPPTASRTTPFDQPPDPDAPPFDQPPDPDATQAPLRE